MLNTGYINRHVMAYRNHIIVLKALKSRRLRFAGQWLGLRKLGTHRENLLGNSLGKQEACKTQKEMEE
jgi:hypothetical protein